VPAAPSNDITPIPDVTIGQYAMRAGIDMVLQPVEVLGFGFGTADDQNKPFIA